MKTFSSKFVMFCMIGMLVCMISAEAHAGNYIGGFCWTWTDPTNGTTGTLQLGITDIGGNHYLCSGVFTVDNYPFSFPPGGKFTTYGNAELIGNEIRITLSFVGIRNGLVGNDMHIITLNPQTLNGTSKGIGVYSDAVELSEGTLTYTNCQ